VREPDYDGAAIERCLVGIQAQENDWDRFLADSGRAARELWYEDLIALTDAVCHAACAAVGVNPPMMFDLAQSGLRKVASGTADEWMLRYRTEGRAGV
jgi:LPS sulfotransferase NodH